ncbi:MAG: ATP synthase subunit I [Lysobacterales bacterium]
MSGVLANAGLWSGALLAGVALGWLHFRSLRWVAERLLAGQPVVVLVQMVRILLLAVFFYLCARLGASTLLSAAAGVLIGRLWVMRRSRLEAS